MTDRAVGGTSQRNGELEFMIWRCAKGRDNRGNFEIFCDQNITKTNYLFFENGDKEDDFKL